MEALKKLLKPIVDLIYHSESNQVYVESTCKNWLQLQKHMQSVELHGLIERDVLMELFQFRWNFIHVPVHGFAYVLNPTTAQSPMDKGICKVRHIRFDDYRDTIEQLKAHFRDYFEDQEKEKAAFEEYEKFCQDLAGDETKNPRAYWATFGMREYPTLAEVASRIFQVQTSAGSAERAWSILAFIETKSRNRIKTDTLDKLAFVKINTFLRNKTASFEDEDYF